MMKLKIKAEPPEDIPTNIQKQVTFVTEVNKNQSVSVLDEEVKTRLCIDNDNKQDYVVDYMAGFPSRKIESSSSFQDLGIEKCTLIFAKPYLVAKPCKISLPTGCDSGIGSTREANQPVLQFGSQREAARHANSLMSTQISSDQYNSRKMKREEKKREEQQKRKAEAKVQTAKKKKPVFKGEGKKLNNHTPTVDPDGLGECVDSIERDGHKDIILGSKMGKNNLGNDSLEARLFESMLNENTDLGKHMKNNMQMALEELKEEQDITSLIATVNDGSYTMKPIPVEEVRKLYGQQLNDSTKLDDFSGCIRVSVHLGHNARGKGKRAMDFALLTKEDLVDNIQRLYHQEVPPFTKKGYLLKPEIIFGHRPAIFWNVVYHAQKEIPLSGRLKYGEMLQKLLPELDWDYLMPKRVTRASTNSNRDAQKPVPKAYY